MSSVHKLEERLMQGFIAVTGVILFVPLLVINNILRPFILSKTIPFQVLVLALLAIWIFLLAIDFKKYRPKFNLLFIALTIFIIAIFLSAVFGLDFYRSFWGNAERTEGFLNIFYFYLFSVSIFSVLKNKPGIFKTLIFVSLIASLAISAFPILQKLNILKVLSGDSLDRASGTFGNPTFLAGYLLVHLFLATAFLFYNLNRRKKFFSVINLITIFIFLVDGVVFVWTQTRGSFIGLFIGLLVALVLSLFVLNKRQKIWIGGFLLLIGFLIGLFLAFRPAIANSPLAKDIPMIGRLSTVSLSDGTTRSRLATWGWSLDWWQKRPIFGAGQDMFYSVFDNNYSANNYAIMSERFDRAHNKYIDVLVMNGIVGFISYLFLLVAIIMAVVRRIKKSETLFLKIFWLAIFGLFIAYFVHNFFVFDTPANSLIFYFLLGGLMLGWKSNSLVEKEAVKITSQPSATPKTSNVPRLLIATAIVVFIIGPVFYYTDYKPYRTGRLVFEAASQSQDISKTFDFYRQAISQNTFINSEARRMWADYWLQVLVYNRFQKNILDPGSLKELSGEVLGQMQLGYQKEAMADFYAYQANIYLQLSNEPGLTKDDSSYYSSQEDKWFDIISQKWPKRTDFYTTYIEDQFLKNNYQQASALIDNMLKETPDFPKASWFKGLIFLVNNSQIESATPFLERALDESYAPLQSDLFFPIVSTLAPKSYLSVVQFLESLLNEKRADLDLTRISENSQMAQHLIESENILSILIQLQSNKAIAKQNPDYNKLAAYLEENLQYQPQNADYWVRLALSYAKLHNKDKAIFAAQQAIKINPNRYQKGAEQFIQAVENGQWDSIN